MNLEELVEELSISLDVVKKKKEYVEILKKAILKEMKDQDVNPLVSEKHKLVFSREVRTKTIWNYPLVLDILFQNAHKYSFFFDTKMIMKYDDVKIKGFEEKYPELKKAVKTESGEEFLVIRPLIVKEKGE